ncbi:MAG: hypothetical protein NC324_02600 [Bacteroides sp.]|nr:hypothetical protein [Bacteroides sp.]
MATKKKEEKPKPTAKAASCTVTETSVAALVSDDKNFNKHTEYGMRILEDSIRKFGLGRSILIDRKNRIIAGNGVVETASQIDLEKVLVVETTGETLVAVKRKDIDLDSAVGRELALADNATAKANLEWDKDVIMEQASKFEFTPEDWGVHIEDNQVGGGEDEETSKKTISTKLIVECGDVEKLSLLFNELQDRGFACKFKE